MIIIAAIVMTLLAIFPGELSHLWWSGDTVIRHEPMKRCSAMRCVAYALAQLDVDR